MNTSAPPASLTVPPPPGPGAAASAAPPAGAPGAAPEALLDIVDPRRIRTVWDWLLPALGILAAVALVALAFWLWRRHRQRQLAPPPPPPPLPPHERARRALEMARRLLDDPNAFCTEVSAILRLYLEERFGWNAPDRTTEEFLAQLERGGALPGSLQELLQDFLRRCDLVKFARADATETELLELQGAALRLVEDTVPPPPPPGAVPTGTPQP